MIVLFSGLPLTAVILLSSFPLLSFPCPSLAHNCLHGSIIYGCHWRRVYCQQISLLSTASIAVFAAHFGLSSVGLLIYVPRLQLSWLFSPMFRLSTADLLAECDLGWFLHIFSNMRCVTSLVSFANDFVFPPNKSAVKTDKSFSNTRVIVLYRSNDSGLKFDSLSEPQVFTFSPVSLRK